MFQKPLHILTALLLAAGSVHASRGKDQQLGQRVENVRTTAYTFGAAENGAYPSSNAIGKPLKTGKVRSAAADWSRWPLGTRFRVVESGQEYIVDDIGSAMVGTSTIDLFKPSTGEMNRWGVRKVTIEILEWGSPDKSLKILQERRGSRHVREMVSTLLAQVAS